MGDGESKNGSTNYYNSCGYYDFDRFFSGIIWALKNKEWIKNTLAEWTRRGIKVIYILVSRNDHGSITLYFSLCVSREETSRLFPGSYHKSHESYIVAMKEIQYDPSYNSNSDRDDPIAEWEAMDVHSLSEDRLPCLLQLIGENRFRFEFYGDNDESIIVTDSFKFKDELDECLRKYRIKYIKKAIKPIDRWKITNRYPT